MPIICCNCYTGQSRLNKGALCKNCFQKKVKSVDRNVESNGSVHSIDIKTTNDINSEPANDKSIIDLIKDNMCKEKKWNDEIQVILKDQVEFLKQEITVKNTLIQLIRLLVELCNKSPYINNIDQDGSISDNTFSTSINGNLPESINDPFSKTSNEHSSLNCEKTIMCDRRLFKKLRLLILHPVRVLFTHIGGVNP